jgi:hypothetical protein
MDKTEHHVMVVVKSTKPYLEVMSRLVGAAKKEFGGAEAHGHDPKKAEVKLRDCTEALNALMAENHRMDRHRQFMLGVIGDIAGRECDCTTGPKCSRCFATAALTELAQEPK